MRQTIVIRNGESARVCAFLAALPKDKAWRVDVREWKSLRSLQQNAYLWGPVYDVLYDSRMLTKFDGHSPREKGWDKEDLHDWLLSLCFGSKTIAAGAFGKTKPDKGSSGLDKQEFSDYLMFVHRFAAEQGIWIADPDEGRWE